MEFNIIDENNKFKLGNAISIFKLPDSEREFVLYSSEDFDGDDSDLCVAYLNKDAEGYDYIEEIKDEEIFKKTMEVVKDMMGVINNG
ncbi:MAG: hypothetical protein IJZ46_02090 [Bacilli bacterium]|nr:hypothetical protein [Bacilli bacterium]